MRIAVITGASSGMGWEFAKQISLWDTFDEMWVIARREDRLQQLAAELSIKTRIIPMDLTKQESFAAYERMLSEQKPFVAALINCSGYGKFGAYDEIPTEDQCGMIDLNCKALVMLTALTLPYMGEGSRVIQVDSLSAFQPVPCLGVYAATKAFVLSYSRSLQQEVRARGIRVVAVCPGWVETEFFTRARQTNDSVISYFNVVYQAKDVVHTALRDAYKTKKDLSIHGFQVKAQVLLVKLLPHRLVMWIWKKQQKIK